ncbi:hypothetical protein KIH87_03645 [Paraneptunicella aestuarii]|uniref:glycosyltransferase n=1 Tax=Paraneptunicella aestuarii TaxID=2831148 RepID=UPI001E5459DD|nr:glycosyltransferase [Paraneptunicella aestuarii]UAA39461.1 hypothetical protein KIH87_03645 [Paraneptunicella aestuarii]
MKTMTFGHVVMTRFSYRQNRVDYQHQSGDQFSPRDPLNPELLDFRFVLFEAACLPNVLGQTNQNFDWVFIIDPELPAKYRQRLEKLISKRERTYLYEFNHGDNLGSLEWLEQYIPDDLDYVLTTNLDDDDILPLNFVEKIQSHVKELGENAPSIKMLGIKSTFQWDLYSSSKYPFGTWAPWHRTKYFKSTGYSMLCNASIRRLTVFSLHHSHGDIWYAHGSEEQNAQIARDTWGVSDSAPFMFRQNLLSKFQEKLEKTNAPGGDDWKSLQAADLHYDFSKDGLFAIHLNHFVNDQGTRLFELKSKDTPVVPEQFFPDDIRIDWNVIKQHGDRFRLSWERYKIYLSEIKLYQKRLRLNWWQSIIQFVGWTTRLTWWFLRH